MANKMDQKLVSSERHELKYFRTWGVSADTVRLAKDQIGPSRTRIMAWLVLYGWIKGKYLEKFEKMIA